MTRATFIRELTDLLLQLEGGMLAFESPLPLQTEESLISAVVAFGDEAVPILLERFAASYSQIGHGYIIDALKRIGNPAAVPALVAFHEHYGSYDSSAAAMQALAALGTEEAYVYMGEILTRYALGNPRVVNSALELVIACRALGKWGDHRAVAPLMAGTQIHYEGAGMPQAAMEALAHYPVAHTYLEKLARQERRQLSPDASAIASTDETDETDEGRDAQRGVGKKGDAPDTPSGGASDEW